MTTAPTRPSALHRFGPVALIVAAVLLVAVIATVKGRPAGEATGGPAGTGDGGGGASTSAPDPTDHPDLPTTFAQADEAGEATTFAWGDGCDLRTGRVKLPSVYAPPCIAVPEGDNGGATWPGVTADEILVAVYWAPPGNDITAALQGLLDPEDVRQRTRVGYVDMLADVFETYGRTVRLVTFTGSGAADDEAKAVADAIRVAEEIKPFAVLGGPALTSAFADELARRKIICIGCGLAVPDSVYQENAPYMWGPLPTPEQFIRNFGDYVVRRLVGGKAEFAGPELRDRERVFGTVNFDQDPPVFSGIRAEVLERGALRGFEAAVSESYLLDVPRLPERAATIVAQLKAAGVTTVLFLGDPIMPMSLTAAATAEGYFPEWVIAGTVLTDTTVLGRLYDPAQWQHAFGLSNLAGRRPLEQQEQFRLYRWYYGEDPEARLTSGIIWPDVLNLMLGIHMAGPKLTPQTFEGGLFSYPPSGGGPTTPQISFGRHGYFPDPDYLAIDDAAEIWWDGEATGPDEQGSEGGVGMWRYASNGTRFLPGRLPSGPPVRDPDTAPTLFTGSPVEDVAPDYPSPR